MSSHSAFVRLLRLALLTASFAVGFCGACRAIRESLPFPDVSLVRPKIEHLAAHRDDYDTLFLGSSRIYYQLIPSLFDELAAARGLPTRSFNAGIAAMRPPEDAYYLDCILRKPPQHLRWIFIELASLLTVEYQDQLGTVRAVYWHDWPRLCILFKRALLPKSGNKRRKWQKRLEDRLQPLGDFFDHLRLFIRNETNLGRGSILTSRLIYGDIPRRDTSALVLGKHQDGWIPTGRPEVMAGRELEDYERALAERRVEPARRDLGDPVSQQALEEMIAKIEKLGATPVLVVPPTTSGRNFYPLPEREQKTLVLDFCDLQKFPELYEDRYRLDTGHLNTAGAEVFTHIFVKTFTEKIRGGP